MATKKSAKRAARQVDKVDTPRGKTRRDWKTRFLKNLRKSANVSASCKAAMISREWAYQERSTEGKRGAALADARKFAAAWDEMIEAAVDDLEQEARRRAYSGLVRKKFTRTGDPIIDPATGKQYFEYEFSDTLMQTLLRAQRPNKYADKARENWNLDVSTLNDKQLELLAAGASLPTVLAFASPGGTGAPEAQPAPTGDRGHAGTARQRQKAADGKR